MHSGRRRVLVCFLRHPEGGQGAAPFVLPKGAVRGRDEFFEAFGDGCDGDAFKEAAVRKGSCLRVGKCLVKPGLQHFIKGESRLAEGCVKHEGEDGSLSVIGGLTVGTVGRLLVEVRPCVEAGV